MTKENRRIQDFGYCQRGFILCFADNVTECKLMLGAIVGTVKYFCAPKSGTAAAYGKAEIGVVK